MSYLDTFSPRDGNDLVPLGKNPRKRNLPWRSVVAFANFAYPLDELEQLRKVLLRESVTFYESTSDRDLEILPSTHLGKRAPDRRSPSTKSFWLV